VIAARCWFGPCTETPSYRLVPADPGLLRPEACPDHLGEFLADTLDRYALKALRVERIPPGSRVDGFREEPTTLGPATRQQRDRFTGMQEVTRPDCGHHLLVAMYRCRLDSPEAIARAQEIAVRSPVRSAGRPEFSRWQRRFKNWS
jgi:hypothetical protein